MPRVKLLTSNVYSPTNPSSEAAIREQIDGSIQEVYDAFTAPTGSAEVGHDSPNIAATNTKDAIEEVYAAISSTVLGEIPDNSIPNGKLATDIKVGSLATLTTTDKLSVVGAINEIDAYVNGVPEQADTIETDLNILRTAKVTTGSNVALAVDTDGTFDLTLEGNILNIIPNVTNTGAMTINADAQGAKSIKKFNIDTDTYVDVEAGDIPKNTPVSLSRSVSNDFFVYAPKGGSIIKTKQTGEFLMDSSVDEIPGIRNITLPIAVDPNYCVVKISLWSADYGVAAFGAYRTTTLGSVTSSTNLQLEIPRLEDTINVLVAWEVIEYKPSEIKTFQKGQQLITNLLETVITLSTPLTKLDKSFLFTNFKHTTNNGVPSEYLLKEIINSTNDIYLKSTNGNKTVNWYVLELK